MGGSAKCALQRETEGPDGVLGQQREEGKADTCLPATSPGPVVLFLRRGRAAFLESAAFIVGSDTLGKGSNSL